MYMKMDTEVHFMCTLVSPASNVTINRNATFHRPKRKFLPSYLIVYNPFVDSGIEHGNNTYGSCTLYLQLHVKQKY